MNITDNDGKMLPAIRNTFTLFFVICGFIAGWFSCGYHNGKATADRLVKDGKGMVIVREDKQEADELLERNIEEANLIKIDGCNDRTGIDNYVRKLRDGRSKRLLPYPRR